MKVQSSQIKTTIIKLKFESFILSRARTLYIENKTKITSFKQNFASYFSSLLMGKIHCNSDPSRVESHINE